MIPEPTSLSHYLKWIVGNILMRLTDAAGETAFRIRNSDNEEILTVTSEGKVGIRATEPRGTLDVDGGGDIWLVDDGLQAGTGAIVMAGHVYLVPYGTTDVAYLQARRWDNSGSTALRLRTYNAGALVEAMHIASDGKVGLGGMVVPNVGLQLVDGRIRLAHASDAPQLLMSDSDNNNTWGLRFQRSDGKLHIVYKAADLWPLAADALVTIRPDGNMGIGAQAPAQKLEVGGQMQWGSRAKTFTGQKTGIVSNTWTNLFQATATASGQVNLIVTVLARSEVSQGHVATSGRWLCPIRYYAGAPSMGAAYTSIATGDTGSDTGAYADIAVPELYIATNAANKRATIQVRVVHSGTAPTQTIECTYNVEVLSNSPDNWTLVTA